MTTKAKGPDNIPNVVLKTCPKRLAPALRYIFQVSSDLASHPNPSYYPLRMTCSKTTTLDHRAFDTVSHNNLLNKMKCYGVDGNINNWLHDFLIDGESSEPVSVDSGVPQLLGLGPLLFLCQMTSRTMTSQQSLQTTASCRASAGFFCLSQFFNLSVPDIRWLFFQSSHCHVILEVFGVYFLFYK